MRTIEWTSQFKRDYKREFRGHQGKFLDTFFSTIELLANDHSLEPRLRDHALSGDWKDHRDCHIKPDLVLIYQKPDDQTLRLVRLGSHSELGFLSRGTVPMARPEIQKLPLLVDEIQLTIQTSTEAFLPATGNRKRDRTRPAVHG
jgi:mRNA interferase YafQ